MAVVKQITLKADTSSAVKDVKKLNKEVDDTSKKGRAAGKGLKGAFAGFGDAVAGAIPMLGRLKAAMISTGVGALVVAFGSLVALFKSAADLGADFGKALSSLRAVSGKTKEELAGLTQQAKDLGESTAFTAVQVVGLQTELAKLGFTVQEIENSTPAILGLASSLEVDLSSAAMLAGSTVRAFGLDTTETQRAVDVLALSTSKSALDFEGLRESLKLVAPTSRATGVSIEKTTALLGILADSGLKGSVAGTGLSKTFIELNKQGLTLEQGLDKVNGSSNKLNTAIDLVGIVGAKSLLNLAGAGDKIGTLTETLEGAAGAAARMSEIRLDNVAGDMTKLGSAWDGFLLGIEDGDGIINKIQRGAIQFLTVSIKFLGEAIDFTGFLFKDFFESLGIGFSMTKDIVGGGFDAFTATIKKFSNEAILLISEIPFIGKVIDAEKIKSNLLVAEQELQASQKRIQLGLLKSNELTIRTNTFFQRYAASQEQKEKKIAQETAKKQAEEMLLEDVEAKKAEEARLKKEREKAEADRLKLLAKLTKKEEDLRADSAMKKLELEKQRAYAEIEALKITEEQKNALRLSYDQSYNLQKTEIDAQLAADKKARDEETHAANVAIFQAEQAMNQRSLDGLISIAGAESKLGKAALIAKQAMAAKELLIDMGVLQSKATKASLEAGLEAAVAGSAVGTGAAKTAASGFPIAIPLLISYGITAAGIIANVIKSVKGTKKVAAEVGGKSSAMPTITSPRSTVGAESQAPQFNVVGTSGASQIADIMGSQPPVKAFVVASDVTTAQGLDRNIIDSATL
tara:strand:+ start:473 stop:2878 length:2406 start_codon:yes stop_codon:yes gene_type:complete